MNKVLGIACFVLMMTLCCDGVVLADDAYFQLPLRSLTLTEGTLPDDVRDENTWDKRDVLIAMLPYAVIDGEGEAFVDFVTDTNAQWSATRGLTLSEARLAVRAPGGKDVAGRLFVPAPDLKNMVMVRFSIPAASAKADGRRAFESARRSQYELLLDRNIAGAAWFRHQIRESKKAIGEHTTGEPSMRDLNVDSDLIPARRNWRDNDDLSSTYALFTGGRAMSENLQLDRVLPPPSTAPADVMVDLDTIVGLTVPPIDWAPLIKDLQPELDPLAALIPEDQHVIFFPSFAALSSLADEAEAQGTPILRLVDVRSENAKSRQRYEKQLGISFNALSRALGPQVVASVAITGSDPYYRTGTDVAVIFEAKNAATLHTLLATQITAATQSARGLKPAQGNVENVPYSGLRSDDRSVCSYLATLGNAVVVTNSLAQLQRLIAVQTGKSPSLKSLPEYLFFRSRYVRGDADETALIFLSDAAIRRWCGPRWRIATSRRMRDAAVMAELQAAYMDDLAGRKVTAADVKTEFVMSNAGRLRLTPEGLWSESDNTLAFLTPLAEIPVTKVTKAEADAYTRWRDTYQRNWRQYFDPIAVRLSVQRDHIGADLSIMPLIAGSEYQDFIGVSQGAAIKPNACDPHDTLAQVILAINTHSPMFQRWGNFASMMAPDIGTGPLDWLGQSVSLYADPDPFWKELADAGEAERDTFFEKQASRLPLALHAEVGNSLKLAAFLTAFRAFAQQTAPGMTVWESLTYNEQPYVKISPTQQAREENDLGNLAVYYATGPDGLVVTLSETVLKHSLDRQAARRTAKAASQPAPDSGAHPWLGTNMGLHASADAVQLLGDLSRKPLLDTLRTRSWGNIPILNEWKRRYPDQDPLTVHETFWQTRLVCPGGGTYVWNDEYQTMESTVFGSPANPKEGPDVPSMFKSFTFGNFGLSFEDKGLRARTELTRTAK